MLSEVRSIVCKITSVKGDDIVFPLHPLKTLSHLVTPQKWKSGERIANHRKSQIKRLIETTSPEPASLRSFEQVIPKHLHLLWDFSHHFSWLVDSMLLGEVLMKGVRDQAGEAAANLGRCPMPSIQWRWSSDVQILHIYGGKPRRITWLLFWPLPIHCQPLGTSGLFDVYMYIIYVYIYIDRYIDVQHKLIALFFKQDAPKRASNLGVRCGFGLFLDKK